MLSKTQRLALLKEIHIRHLAKLDAEIVGELPVTEDDTREEFRDLDGFREAIRDLQSERLALTADEIA